MHDEIKKEIELHREFLRRCHVSGSDNFYMVELIDLVYPHKRIGMNEIETTWKRFLAGPRRGPLNLYIHIPYCFERCHFCTYSGFKLERESELSDYVVKLKGYLRRFSSIFKGEEFTNLYIGGGTPSILSEGLMEDIFNELSSFSLVADGERTFEMSPINSSRAKIDIIGKSGFNRVSFGVQSFNSEVLKLNNRGYQTNEMVVRAVEDAKKAGIDFINLDLIGGLYGESERSIIDGFEKALSLEPYSISFYPLQPVSGYLEMTFGLDRKSYFEYRYELLIKVFPELKRIANLKGYVLTGSKSLNLNDSGSFSFKKIDHPVIQANSYIFQDRNMVNSVLGIGGKSFSHISGKVRYKMNEDLVENPNDYFFDATPYDEKREMLGYILSNLSYNKSVSIANFKYNFEKDLVDEFHEPIRKMRELGLMSIKDDDLSFVSDNPEDCLLHSLFFFDPDELRTTVNKFNKEVKKERTLVSSKKSKNGVVAERRMREVMDLNKKEKTDITDGMILKKDSGSLILRSRDNEEKIFSIKKGVLVVDTITVTEDFSLHLDKEISFDDLVVGNPISITSVRNGECIMIKRIRQ